MILSGVVGSGKSTFSTALTLHNPSWARVSQDDLGNRIACEVAVRKYLQQGKNVVVDRQNFDRAQRSTWFEIAKGFEGVRVVGFVMGTSYTDCRNRLIKRRNHPTINSSQLALELLDKFSDAWQQPSIEEGYDKLIILPSLPPPAELTKPYLDSLFVLLTTSLLNPHAADQRIQGKKWKRPPAPKVAPLPGTDTTSTWRAAGTSVWSWATAGPAQSLADS